MLWVQHEHNEKLLYLTIFWGLRLSLLPMLSSSEKFRSCLLLFASKQTRSWKWHRLVMF